MFKQLLGHQTHCHNRWTKRRDGDSLHPALWARFGRTVLVRAFGGADTDGTDQQLIAGEHRKMGLELVDNRVRLPEGRKWTELLRTCVRDLLYGMRQSDTHKAGTMRASGKMDSCDVTAALQILRNTRTAELANGE